MVEHPFPLHRHARCEGRNRRSRWLSPGSVRRPAPSPATASHEAPTNDWRHARPLMFPVLSMSSTRLLPHCRAGRVARPPRRSGTRNGIPGWPRARLPPRRRYATPQPKAVRANWSSCRTGADYQFVAFCCRRRRASAARDLLFSIWEKLAERESGVEPPPEVSRASAWDARDRGGGRTGSRQRAGRVLLSIGSHRVYWEPSWDPSGTAPDPVRRWRGSRRSGGRRGQPGPCRPCRGGRAAAAS